MKPQKPGAGAGRGDLAEWVAYLKDIGVREMRRPRPARRAAALPAVSDSRSTVRSAQSTAPSARSAKPADQPVLLAVDERGFDTPAPDDPAQRLQEVCDDLGQCTRCKLHAGRTNVVFGVGNPKARLMFIGEGPGQQEDLQGEPFVGRAGHKLDQMIEAIGLSRAEVYIANIVKCRPPNNRDPERDEIETCSPFLVRQIEAIRPRVIVTLGGPATKTLLSTRVGITRLRGEWHSYRKIPVMPTFHPAYVLRNYTQRIRKQVWDDLKAARARADE